MFDDINLSERAPDGDALILDLFHQWQAAMKDANDVPDSTGAAEEKLFEEKMDVVREIERHLAGTAASGVVGLAIKGVLAAYNQMISDGEVSDRVLASIIEDGVRFVPELAPLAEQIPAEPLVAEVVAASDEVLSGLPPRELHRRWAAAQGEYEQLGVEIDERETDAKLRQGVEWCGWLLRSDADIEEKTAQAGQFTFPNQREQEIARLKALLVERQRSYEAGIKAQGIAPLITRFAALKAEIDRLLDEIAERPVRSIEDIAIRLDVAIECDINDGQCQWPWLLDAARGLVALQPDACFIFTSFRRNVELGRALDRHGIPLETTVTDDDE